VGVALTTVSLLIAAAQIGIFDCCRRRMGIHGVLLYGGVLVGFGLLGLGAIPATHAIPGSFVALAASAIAYAIGVALLSPALPTLLMQMAPEGRRGTLFGVESIFINFGRVAAPPLFGLLLGKGAMEKSGVVMIVATVVFWLLLCRRDATAMQA